MKRNWGWLPLSWRKKPARLRAARPGVELLEDRVVPTISFGTPNIQSNSVFSARAVLVADLSGDGLSDLIVGNAGSSQGISVQLGQSGGGYPFALSSPGSMTFATPSAVTSMALADFDRDGLLDLAVGLNGTTPGIRVYPGRGGSPVFRSPISINTANAVTAVAAADLNRDGLPDLVVGENAATNGVQIFENTSTGPLLFTFAAAVGFNTTNPVTRVAVGDLNRDLWPDVVVGENTAASGLQVFENIIVNPNDTIGSGSLATPVTFATGGPVSGLQLQSLGGASDLEPDVVVGTTNLTTGVQVLINKLAFPNQTITGALLDSPISFATVAQVTDLLVSDVDQDGFPDALAANNALPATSIQAFPGTGTATVFDTAVDINDGGLADGANRAIALRDLTGDSLLDLVVVADVTVNQNQGVIPNTTALPPPPPPPSPPTPPVTLTPTQRFINNLYLDLLGRAADTAGLNYWTGQLNAGVSRADVALALANSFEALAQDVRRAFREFLGRDPETNALIHFTNLLQLGRPIVEIEVAIVTSAEFQSLPGGFLANLYNRALKRSLDPDGSLFWQTLLSVGRLSVQQVAFAILTNTERAGILINFAGTAAAGFWDIGFYQRFLNKNADASGAAFWTNLLATQMLNRQLIKAAFTNTPEYFIDS